MPTPTDPRSMKQRMLAGGPYLADDAELQADSRHAAVMTARYNQTAPEDHAGRDEILKSWFGAVGRDVMVRPPLVADYGKYVCLGDRVFINWNAVFVDVVPITIGDDTLIGPNCQFLAATHPLDIQDRLDKWEGGKPITLGKNVWLGGGVIVCPGVTIGDHSVIGAGSVVTRDIPPRSVAVGNPARVIKTI